MVCEVCGHSLHELDACGCVTTSPCKRSFLHLRTLAYVLLAFASVPLIECSALAWLLLLLTLAGLVCSLVNYEADPLARAETRGKEGSALGCLMVIDPFLWMCLIAGLLHGC